MCVVGLGVQLSCLVSISIMRLVWLQRTRSVRIFIFMRNYARSVSARPFPRTPPPERDTLMCQRSSQIRDPRGNKCVCFI